MLSLFKNNQPGIIEAFNFTSRYILSLFENNQADIIEAFNSTSRYLVSNKCKSDISHRTSVKLSKFF